MKWMISITVMAVVMTGTVLADGFYFGFDSGPMSFRYGYNYWYGSDWYNSPDSSLDFEMVLDGFGSWLYLPAYGRVWIPYVEIGWRPYLNGHWVWTSYGWTWIAYEPWGYVPHHFGRWAFDPGYGWFWVPGYEWGPAWVNWRYSGSYCGWAPLPPPHHRYHYRNDHYRGNYQHYHWEGQRRPGNVAWPYEVMEEEGWTFVGNDRFNSEDIARVAMQKDSAYQAFNFSQDRTVNKAPSRQEIESWSHAKVPEVSVSVTKTSIAGKSVNIVRPKNQLNTINRHADEVTNKFIKPAMNKAQKGGVRRNQGNATDKGGQDVGKPEFKSPGYIKPGAGENYREQPSYNKPYAPRDNSSQKNDRDKKQWNPNARPAPMNQGKTPPKIQAPDRSTQDKPNALTPKKQNDGKDAPNKLNKDNKKNNTKNSNASKDNKSDGNKKLEFPI